MLPTTWPCYILYDTVAILPTSAFLLTGNGETSHCYNAPMTEKDYVRTAGYLTLSVCGLLKYLFLKATQYISI